MFENQKSEQSKFAAKPLSDDDLEMVSGGTNGEFEDDNFSDFQAAWNRLGFFEEGRTRHEMESLYESWQATGFAESAYDFLLARK